MQKIDFDELCKPPEISEIPETIEVSIIALGKMQSRAKSQEFWLSRVRRDLACCIERSRLIELRLHEIMHSDKCLKCKTKEERCQSQS